MDEFDRIARLARRFGLPPSPAIGIGDDCALVPPTDRWTAWKVDASVEGVHFDRAFISLEHAAARAVEAAMSDLAAAGATPAWSDRGGCGLLVALTLPSDLSETDFDSLIEGIARSAERVGAVVLGGNLSGGPMLSITTTAIGRIEARGMRRHGAKPGDRVYVTGVVGAAGLGLRALQRFASKAPHEAPPQPRFASKAPHEAPPQPRFASKAPHEAPPQPRFASKAPHEAPPQFDARFEPFASRWRSPRARIAEGLFIATFAHASVDLSDGLAADLGHIAHASNCGIVLDVAALPMLPDQRECAAVLGLDATELALHAGEDYEVAFTAATLPSPPANLASFTEIGECIDTPGIFVRDGQGTRAIVPRGFNHFG